MTSREEAQPAADSVRPELPSTPRFSTSLRASGPFRPGQPVTVTASTTVHEPAAEAELRIVAPELDLEYTEDGPRAPRPGDMRPLARQRSSVARGQRVVQQATVVFDEPGYYRIVASAVTRSTQRPTNEAGLLVRDATHEELWILVTPEGGRVVGTAFDSSAVPAVFEPTPGRFRARQDDAWRAARARRGANEAGATLMVDGAQHRQIAYANYDLGRWTGLPGVEVYSYEIHRTTGAIYDARYEYTSDDGYYPVRCPVRGSDYEVRGVIQLRNADVAMRLTPVISFTENALSCTLEPTMLTIGESEMAHVFANMTRTAPASRALLGYARGRILVNISTKERDTYYSPSDDKIQYEVGRVWGYDGVFVAAHEYGHAAHEKALGGNAGGGCPDPHYFDAESNYTCAYSEGFANYHAVATRGLETQSYFYAVETPSLFSRPDASERVVAGVFFDLTDPANETGDVVQYPGKYVADLVRTCEIYPFRVYLNFQWRSVFRRTDGIDGIVYCAEQRVDPAIRQSFSPRLYYITHQRESAIEPGGTAQAANVRLLWRWNFFQTI